jgi:hypothetical protein
VQSRYAIFPVIYEISGLVSKVGYEKKNPEFRYIHAAVCSSLAGILSLSFLSSPDHS